MQSNKNTKVKKKHFVFILNIIKKKKELKKKIETNKKHIKIETK
jgi:hypothetical protein